jgi:hypothetical protein
MCPGQHGKYSNLFGEFSGNPYGPNFCDDKARGQDWWIWLLDEAKK